MFINTQPKELTEKYKKLLQAVGALSRLSSDNGNIPSLYYRMAENIFCRAFKADNLSRSDVSIDAQKDNIGFGLKTFLHKNGKSFEKIAEFNKESEIFNQYLTDHKHLVEIVSGMRNKRILNTTSIYDIDSSNVIYYCVTRDSNLFNIYETPMDLVNIDKIKHVKKVRNSIFFDDGKNEYSFSLSKNTLLKRFNISPILQIDAPIFEDPFVVLEKLFKDYGTSLQESDILEQIVLPLYSTQGEQRVPEKSGLNQWNAKGRERNPDEIYISIPLWIHKRFEGFFPPKDTNFNLHLPNKEIIQVKICQQGGKALMSNPNSALGKWLLRDVLKLKYEELLTYRMLEEIGIDSVEIIKKSQEDFHINFKRLDSFSEFEKTYKL